jgi:hypothetical protein
VYDDGLRVTSVTYPLFGSLGGMGLVLTYGTDDSLTDKLSRSASEKLDGGSLNSSDHTTNYQYNGVGRPVDYARTRPTSSSKGFRVMTTTASTGLGAW